MLTIKVTMTMTNQTHHSIPELGGLSPLVSMAGGVAFVVVEVDSVVVDVVVAELVVVVAELVVVDVVDVVGH